MVGRIQAGHHYKVHSKVEDSDDFALARYSSGVTLPREICDLSVLYSSSKRWVSQDSFRVDSGKAINDRIGAGEVFASI